MTASKPGYEEVLRGQLALKAREGDKRPHGGELTNVRLPLMMRELALAAARKRGLSLNSYMRRAIMAFVVKDLGLAWDVVMGDEPGVFDFDKVGGIQRLKGQGYGPWRIRRLE